MKKLALILFLAAFAFVAFANGPADATEPPAYGIYGEGWGENPNNWDHQSGSYDSGLCLWNPGEGYVNSFNHDGNGGHLPIQYDDITIELWVELHMISTYEATSYQFHRIGNAAETVEFIISGTVQSNQQNWCGLTRGDEDLDKLHFGGGMYGGGGDIDLTWQYRYGNGLTYGGGVIQGWTPITPDGNGDIGIVIDKCDHWFQFKGQFDLPYHIDDGYYSLTIAGCPTPNL